MILQSSLNFETILLLHRYRLHTLLKQRKNMVLSCDNLAKLSLEALVSVKF